MDRREGHPRQSSLPSSLHQHIVTRPHPQPRSTDPSQTGHSQRGEADGGGGPFDESPYQLRPIAPSLSPSTFGDDSRRTFGLPQRRATDSPEPDDVSDDDDGGHTFRTFMPLPRRTTNRYVAAHSSIPHGLPPIRSIFNAPPLTYAYYAPVRVPLPQGDRDRTLPPSWQEGEAGPSSLSRSRPQQSRPSRWIETRSQTQPETALGERILGLRPFERQTDPTNRADVILRQTHVSDRPEFEGGEYPGRDAATAQLAPDAGRPPHSSQHHDAHRSYSLPSQFVPVQRPIFFPSNRAEDEALTTAPYAGLGDLPYSQDIASSSTSVKKEFRASSLERPERARDFGDTDEDAPPRKKARRKAVVACDFCKKRKLRCSTDKPMCSNCSQRGLKCVYGLPKRRGPGKAPRGSRSKKTDKPPPPPGYLPFAGLEFGPDIPGYRYPFPPHSRSDLAPPDTEVSSRSAASPAPSSAEESRKRGRSWTSDEG